MVCYFTTVVDLSKHHPLTSIAFILNYALTLEHLEDTFYRTGLAKLSADDFAKAGFPSDTYDKVTRIAYDEKTHVSFLTSALGAAKIPAVAECTYDFGGAFNDPKSFLATASVLEGVGVSAYLGAAADIMSKGYLTAAGSILTIEARHTSYIRNTIGESPFPQPFDDPLSENAVYTLAAGFITGCPSSNPTLPLMAFPSLTVTCADATITTGSTLTVAVGSNYNPKGATVYAAFITVTGPVIADIWGNWQVTIPAGIAGQSYLVLTTNETMVTDDSIVAGPAIIEIAS